MGDETSSRILRVGLINPISLEEVDPARVPSQEVALIAQQIFDTPFSLTLGSDRIEPNLAARLEASPEDPHVTRLHLREALRFADGSELNLDVAYASLRRYAAGLPDVETSLEDGAITIWCGQEDTRLDLLLSAVESAVARYQSGRPIGTGAFCLHPESEPSRVRLVRNPHDHRPCTLDEIRFEAFPLDGDGQATAIIDAFHDQRLDLSFAVPRDDVGLLRGVRKRISPGLSTAVLTFNVRRPELADPKVRRAIALALNRYEISKICHKNPLAFKATALLPRGMATGDDGLNFNLEQARTSMPAHPLSEPLTLLPIWCPRPYLPEPLEVAKKIADQLAAIGIQIRIRPVASSREFFKRVVAGKDDLILAGWMADNTDPWAFLTALLDSRRLTRLDKPAMTANHGAYQSLAMDRLLERYRHSRDAETLSQITDLMRQDVPLVPLMYGAQTVVCSYRVQGLGQCLVPVIPLRNLRLA